VVTVLLSIVLSVGAVVFSHWRGTRTALWVIPSGKGSGSGSGSGFGDGMGLDNSYLCDC
jgi:hypothetical protein